MRDHLTKLYHLFDAGGLRLGMLLPSGILAALAAAISTDVISFLTEADGRQLDTMAFLLEIRTSGPRGIPQEYTAQTVAVSVLVGIACLCVVVANVGMSHLLGFVFNVVGTLLLMIEVGTFSQLRTNFNTDYATPESGRFAERIEWGPALTFHIVAATALIFSCVAQFFAWAARRKGRRARLVYYCIPQVIAMLACCGGVRAAQAWREGEVVGTYVGWHYFDISEDIFTFDASCDVCTQFLIVNAVLSGVIGVASLASLGLFCAKAMNGRSASTFAGDVLLCILSASAIGVAAAHGKYACEGWVGIHFGPSIYLMATALLGTLIEIVIHLRTREYAEYTPLLN